MGEATTFQRCRFCGHRHPIGADHIYDDAPDGSAEIIPDEPPAPVEAPVIPESSVLAKDVARADRNRPSVVVDAPQDRAGGAVGGSNPPAPELAPEPTKRPLTGVERQMRWRAKNRERYNSYMAEYRKRKRDEAG